MIILAIDTSCDDTCIAILKTKNQKPKIGNFEILCNIVSSQTKIHAKYGGVYPFLAKREHQRNLPIILKKALKGANFSISNFKFLISKQIPNSKSQISKIDLIAVTVGPGLEPCLWTGINFAENLAKNLNIPIVPVNHIEAHIFANLLPQIRSKPKTKDQKPKIQIKNKKIKFPAICLIVSGGHTQLIFMKDFGKYEILGETRDDAAGECLDKIARLLGLGYPGGPAIAAEAAKFKVQSSKFKVELPRPMLYQKNYDFSFSGLKTAVLYKVKGEKRPARIATRSVAGGKAKSEKYIRMMCVEVQQAIIDVLIAKTLKAAREYRAKAIILGGGVAANEELRKQFNLQLLTYNLQLKFFVPPKNLCTDNAAMVGAAGYFNWLKNKKKFEGKLKADANLRLK